MIKSFVVNHYNFSYSFIFIFIHLKISGADKRISNEDIPQDASFVPCPCTTPYNVVFPSADV